MWKRCWRWDRSSETSTSDFLKSKILERKDEKKFLWNFVVDCLHEFNLYSGLVNAWTKLWWFGAGLESHHVSKCPYGQTEPGILRLCQALLPSLCFGRSWKIYLQFAPGSYIAWGLEFTKVEKDKKSSIGLRASVCYAAIFRCLRFNCLPNLSGRCDESWAQNQ